MTGSFNPETPVENPTFVMLMQQVELAYNLNRYEVEEEKEIGPVPIMPKPEEISIRTEYGPWEHDPDARFESLIPVSWGQSGDPYNRYTKHLSPHAGCVTAAVAQIMAFHSYPHSYDWKEMLKYHPLDNPFYDPGNDYIKDQIGRLYRDLGESLDVDYGPDGSGASSEDVPNTFWEFGYTNGGTFGDFSFEKVREELCRANGQGYPVYISAKDRMKVKYKYFLWWNWKEITYEPGHAFVIDGVSKVCREVRSVNAKTGEVISSHYETMDLLHANIGWDAPWFNGYYHKDVFDLRYGYGPILYNMINSTVGDNYVYRYNFQTVTKIRP